MKSDELDTASTFFDSLYDAYGAIGILLFALFALLFWPGLADRARELFLTPIFALFKFADRYKTAADVGNRASEFLESALFPLIPGFPRYRVRVKWINGPEDLDSLKGGILVLRMKANSSRVVNILNATRLAFSRAFFPIVRMSMKGKFLEAVDLGVIQKLAIRLGGQSPEVFQRDFLGPALAHPDIQRAFERVVTLDRAGLLAPIFLAELVSLEAQFKDARVTAANDLQESLDKFVDFLASIAERELGAEIELTHSSKYFRLAVILLAKSAIREKYGTYPYLRRYRSNLARGYDTIYLISFPPARSLFKRLSNIIVDDERTQSTILDRIPVILDDAERVRGSQIDMLVCRRRALPNAESFRERCLREGITEGVRLSAKVIDVSEDIATLGYCGISLVLRKRDCSALWAKPCDSYLSNGEHANVYIIGIDEANAHVMVSLVDPKSRGPIRDCGIAKGMVIDTVIVQARGADALGEHAGLRVFIPNRELALGVPPSAATFVGKSVKCVVIDFDDTESSLVASIKDAAERPWEDLVADVRVGDRHRGIVDSVDREGVYAYLETIPIRVHLYRASLLSAGHEFADFERSVVPGQGLDLVITKIYQGKKRISVDLARNVSASTNVTGT